MRILSRVNTHKRKTPPFLLKTLVDKKLSISLYSSFRLQTYRSQHVRSNVIIESAKNLKKKKSSFSQRRREQKRWQKDDTRHFTRACCAIFITHKAQNDESQILWNAKRAIAYSLKGEFTFYISSEKRARAFVSFHFKRIDTKTFFVLPGKGISSGISKSIIKKTKDDGVETVSLLRRRREKEEGV